MRVLVAAGVGGGTAAAVFMGTAIASLYAVGGSADYSKTMRRGTALPAWSGR